MLQKNWQDLIKPEKLVTEAGVDSGRTATIVAEPLERGFGLTLGNALRRVLLSSLQGAAVTSIKIDNVLHEFSSIPGVREDVVDIVLNIKAMAVKMQGDREQRLYLRAVGPGEVTAGMIELPGDVQIMDAKHLICTLDDGASISMELMVATGKGYGATNFIALDRAGEVLVDRIIQVEGPTDQLVTVYRGVERESYSCMPICQRRVTLGDGDGYFKTSIDQAGALNSTAQGTAATAGKSPN